MKAYASVQALSHQVKAREVPAILPHLPTAYCGLPADQAVKLTAAPPGQRQAHLQVESLARAK